MYLVNTRFDSESPESGAARVCEAVRCRDGKHGVKHTCASCYCVRNVKPKKDEHSKPKITSSESFLQPKSVKCLPQLECDEPTHSKPSLSLISEDYCKQYSR